MRRRNRAMALGIGIITLILIFAFLILPGIVRDAAISAIETATSRKAQLAGVSLNPLNLSAEFKGFRLSEPGNSTTFASFSSARISVSPASLFRKALIVSELEIRAPYLRLVRSQENRYNFSDLLEQKSPKQKNSKPFLFSLNNIEIKNGSADFMDNAIDSATRHTVRDFDLAVPFVSNIPYLSNHYVSPRLSAVVNGTPLLVSGSLKPMTRAVEATARLAVKGLNLPYYLGYLPREMPLRITSGSVTTDLNLAYRVSAAERPDLTIDGRLSLDRLEMKEKGGRPLLALERGEIAINRSQLFSKLFDISRLSLKRPELYLERDADGGINLQRVRPQRETHTPQPESPATNLKPRLTIAAVQIENGQLHFRDQLAANGTFISDIENLNLDLLSFSTEPNRQATWRTYLRTRHGETLQGNGDLMVEPLSVTARLSLTGIRPEVYHPYLAEYLTSPVAGKIDVSATLYYRPSPAGISISDFILTGRGIMAKFTTTDSVTLQNLVISGGKLDLATRQANLERIEIKGGSVRLTKEPDGGLSAARLIRTQLPAPSTPNPSSTPPPFSYRIDSASVDGMDATFTDQSVKGDDKPLLTLRRAQISLSGISGPKAAPVRFTFSANYGKAGKLKSSGIVTPAPFGLKGKIDVNRIPLRDFEAYLPENLNLYVADGTVDTHATLNLASTAQGMTGSFSGDLGIRSFYCMDTVEFEDLLKWESLQMDGISGRISPFALTVKQVALNGMYAKIVINKDGSINLQQLKTEDTAPPQHKPAPTAPVSPPVSESATARKDIRIETITIQAGTLGFEDRHLPVEFVSTFYNLGGKVAGISTDETHAADVDLRGNLENHSPLRITGTLNPLWSDPLVDLKISFTDIDLSPFTPYSGTYLGYTVDKGKLFLDLKYRIEKKALISENRIFIDQFTLGESVKSDKATSLPVGLAIALLKDRKGEIHLDLPVSGRTDDPKFSVWSVVMEMLKNLLVKAATSPFALLSSLIGGGDDFSAIAFSPGSARIDPPEQAKLAKLSAALLDRPALKVDISGYVDRELDSEGFRTEQLARKMKTEKFLALSKARQNQPGQTPDSIDLLPEEHARYLAAVYAKEKFPKPRNALGFIKELPETEMRKLILANTASGELQMQTLARERETAVRDFLLQQGKVPGERLFLKSGNVFKTSGKDGVGNSRVEFGAGVP